MSHDSSNAAGVSSASLAVSWPRRRQASIVYNRNIGRGFGAGQLSSPQLSSPHEHFAVIKVALSKVPEALWEDMVERDARTGIEQVDTRRCIIPPRGYEAFKNARSMSDEAAATAMEKGFLSRVKRWQGHLTARILRDLVDRRAKLEDYSLDNLLLASDKVIFGGTLSGRVWWRWSCPDEHRYEHEVLGTTAIHVTPHGGFKTEIVLSNPLLRNGKYNRDLLISAFLHELVHCYLFIQCGLNHAERGGHTKGFRRIARIINKWIGHQRLHLCNMRANLDDFRIRDATGYQVQNETVVDEGYVSQIATPEYVPYCGGGAGGGEEEEEER